MRKTTLYMSLAAAILDMGGYDKANQPVSADNGGIEVETAGAPIELSVFAGSTTENVPTDTGLKAMVDYINKNGGGTLKATDYYGTTLGDATSMVQGLRQGTTDIGVSGTTYFSGLVPEVGILQLPFLLDNLEEVRVVIDGAASEKIFEKFVEKGIMGLTFWENGFRRLSNSVRPVTTPAGLSDIEMRTLSATAQVETWKILGTLPTAIDAPELCTALQQDTVSTEESPPHEIVSRKFCEVWQYITLTDHVYTPLMMGINQRTWDRLSDQQKSVVTDVANTGKEARKKTSEEKTIGAGQVLLDNGYGVVENPDKEAFKETAVSVQKVFIDGNGIELLDIIQKN